MGSKCKTTTRDSRVVATFEQECQSHSTNRNLVMASFEYVGWIEKLLKVDFRRFQIVLFLCNWVVANYGGSNAIVKWDQYGYTFSEF